jgi:hypothetical protein
MDYQGFLSKILVIEDNTKSALLNSINAATASKANTSETKPKYNTIQILKIQ